MGDKYHGSMYVWHCSVRGSDVCRRLYRRCKGDKCNSYWPNEGMWLCDISKKKFQNKPEEKGE